MCFGMRKPFLNFESHFLLQHVVNNFVEICVLSIFIGTFEGKSVEFKKELDLVSVKFLDERFIENHEHEDGEDFFGCKVADADGSEKAVPVEEALVLEIKNLEEPSLLVLNGGESTS
jgi:hypothetical protein